MKISLVYGRIEEEDVKTERKTFKVPYFDPWEESPITLEVTMEERHELDKFLYELRHWRRYVPIALPAGRGGLSIESDSARSALIT